MNKKDLMLMLIGVKFAASHAPKIVTIENGRVQGAKEEMHQVVEWFGIPYAAPAKGEFRWRKPMPAPKMKGILDCRKPPQEHNIQNFGSKTFGTEGELTLDVCRPDNKRKKLPVMVYFHGGNFQVGHAQEWMGNKFCQEKQVVYVSVEYRLEAFGFVNLPALKTGDPMDDSGNFAILDCLAALQWIQRNIEAFGGDPNNVTVSGHSAGGVCCLTMIISKLFKGLFHKVVTFNSPAVVCDHEKSELVFAHRFAKLALEDGLKENEEEAVAWLTSREEADLAAVKEWLYGLDAMRIAKLFPLAGVRMHEFPTLFTDGYVIPKEGYNTTELNHVPLVVYASDDEFSAFVGVDPYFKKRLKINPFNPKTQAEFKFATKYGSELYRHINSHYIGYQLFDRYKAPIYVGNFVYGTSVGGVTKEFMQRHGAVHGIVLPFLTDQYKIPWKRGNDFFQHTGAECLSIIFCSSIKSFMVDGNPNCADMEIQWKEWKPGDEQEIRFDADRERCYVTEHYNNFTHKALFDQYDADTSVNPDVKDYIIHNVLNNRWFSKELDERYGNKSMWPEA